MTTTTTIFTTLSKQREKLYRRTIFFSALLRVTAIQALISFYVTLVRLSLVYYRQLDLTLTWQHSEKFGQTSSAMVVFWRLILCSSAVRSPSCCDLSASWSAVSLWLLCTELSWLRRSCTSCSLSTNWQTQTSSTAVAEIADHTALSGISFGQYANAVDSRCGNFGSSLVQYVFNVFARWHQCLWFKRWGV